MHFSELDHGIFECQASGKTFNVFYIYSPAISALNILFPTVFAYEAVLLLFKNTCLCHVPQLNTSDFYLCTVTPMQLLLYWLAMPML